MKQRQESPKRSAEIADYIAGDKRDELLQAAQAAVRDAIELNELLDKQRERRESEARARPSANKR